MNYEGTGMGNSVVDERWGHNTVELRDNAVKLKENVANLRDKSGILHYLLTSSGFVK